MHFTFEFEQTPEPNLNEELLEQIWDQRLSRPHSMAPTELVESGQLTEEEESHQNRAFSSFAQAYLLKQISAMKKEIDPRDFQFGKILHAGTGEGDDLDYIPHALEENLKPVLIDVSRVAIRKAEKFLSKLPEVQLLMEKKEPPLCLHVEFERYCTNSHGLQPKETLLVYASRIFQHMLPDKYPGKFTRILAPIGRFLLEPGRRLVVIHLFPQHNPAEGLRSSYPFSVDDFLDALASSTGADFCALEEKAESFHFYHQVYTAMTFMAVGRLP